MKNKASLGYKKPIYCNNRYPFPDGLIKGSTMTVISRLRIFARTFATDSRLVFRYAAMKDADILTRRAIQENWHIGPHDYRSSIAFDPKSFLIGEVDGEIAAHIGVIEFPNHHYHGGGLIVTDKYRQNDFGPQCVLHVMRACNNEYTIGADVSLDSLTKYESLGAKKYWDTYVAVLSPEKIAKKFTEAEQCDSIVQTLHEVDLDKLLRYDHGVFGTPRNTLITRWINTPGSFGFVAIDKSSNEITGYNILKQVIREGTEIGLAMTPLYADNPKIAKLLVKVAVKECITNPAIPKTNLELVHPVGDNCGEGAAELMKDLDAEFILICYRVYTKGIPPGRQMKKIYGIASPSCD